MVQNEMTEDISTSRTDRLCLDFANTADWHASDHPTEHLNSYDDLVSWARRVGIVTNGEARELSRQAKKCPADAAQVLQQAITLREAIYRILSAVAGARPPKSPDVATVNAALSQALVRLQVIPVEDRFTWAWIGEKTVLDRMLWPVARSAADLLTSKRLVRVGACADDRGCGFLFLDMSRNRSRRWCDMKDCGNRAKAKRHYERTRESNLVSE